MKLTHSQLLLTQTLSNPCDKKWNWPILNLFQPKLYQILAIKNETDPFQMGRACSQSQTSCNVHRWKRHSHHFNNGNELKGVNQHSPNCNDNSLNDKLKGTLSSTCVPSRRALHNRPAMQCPGYDNIRSIVINDIFKMISNFIKVIVVLQDNDEQHLSMESGPGSGPSAVLSGRGWGAHHPSLDDLCKCYIQYHCF